MSGTTASIAMPYGVKELEPNLFVSHEQQPRVRCYVRGCKQLLRPPSWGISGEVCHEHGIRCHYSRGRGTYSYREVRRNLIVGQDVFMQRVLNHPFKYESHRFSQENSEDALTWNVFRSLQEAGCLSRFAELVTGEKADEPQLYLWGLRASDDSFEPWDLLIAARNRFESNLPVKRPPTEPDIALHLPGKYLILIEAKFTSPNPCYIEGPRKSPTSLTKAELVNIYQDARLRCLDYELAAKTPAIPYQLWRNMIFAEWMARLDGFTTKPYMANLTRCGIEQSSCAQFRTLIQRDMIGTFSHLSWEGIAQIVRDHDQANQLLNYLKNKTACLKQTFSWLRHAR